MKYTKEFVDKIKEAYPDYEKMHQMVDENNPNLGMYLRDNRDIKFTPEHILNTPYEALIKEAKVSKVKNELYEMFCSGKCYVAEEAVQTKKDKNEYVGARDLIPGNLYYGAGVWRNTWVYLGRTSDKKFVWYFIGNDEKLMANPTVEAVLNDCSERNLSVTKSNKKVKSFSNLLSDDNYKDNLWKPTKELALRNVRVYGVDTLTTEKLDYLARLGLRWY